METVGAVEADPQGGWRGRHEFTAPADYRRSGCPDHGVRTSRFKPLSHLLSP